MKGDLRTLDDDGCKKNHFQQHRLNKDIIAAEVPQPLTSAAPPSPRLRDRIHQIAESLTTDTLRLSTLPPVSHHHLRKLDHAHYRCSSLAYSVTDNGVPIHNLTFYSPPTAPHFDIMQKHLKSLKMGGDNPTWGLLSDIDIQRLYDMAEKGEELVRLSCGVDGKGWVEGLAVDVVERDAAGLKGSAEEVLYRYSEMRQKMFGKMGSTDGFVGNDDAVEGSAAGLAFSTANFQELTSSPLPSPHVHLQIQSLTVFPSNNHKMPSSTSPINTIVAIGAAKIIATARRHSPPTPKPITSSTTSATHI
ncbi:hypothetical protein BC829DRAFT_492135 [Chytridium lagenaria]|nr:hypothetical protein BC829DRAFT_492135 [Chytridium lagenaria]